MTALPSWVRPLRAKYAEMLALRRAHDAGEAGDPTPRLRALAARFPGALRELDELPMQELERRVAYLEAACVGAVGAEPWAPLLHRYHELLTIELAGRTGATKRGRPSLAALAKLGEERGISEDELRAHVFPYARGRRKG